ncbi:MAG TPA: hypothetical protein VF453_00250 [Burkholderiaceae bacterium]
MTSPATTRLTPAAMTLAVFAPFGNDPVLSGYPDGATRDVEGHPIVGHLREVAATGVDVLLLIDRVDDRTHLVRLPAGGEVVDVEDRGKLDMLSPRTLADFVALAHACDPRAQLVLTFEGHGAGFMPELDAAELARLKAEADETYEWREERGVQRPFHRTGARANQPVEHRGAPLPGGNPTTPGGSPTMPGGSPTMPAGHRVMSTWALGEGLRLSGAPRVAVLHFNNCFNMAVEVLHTVAPYAEAATGYCNYNFFSAGQAYPAVFRRLAEAGGASALELAKWFADENHRVLHAAGHEPTVAGTVALERMQAVAAGVDALSDALLEALRGAPAGGRHAVVDAIRDAIVAAQQYDSNGDDELDAPDELTDLDSLAAEFSRADFGDARVRAAAKALHEALADIKQYGDTGSPWMAPGVHWDFASENLAMNIFLPDPLLDGVWDWRSQYYLSINPDTTRPQPQRHVIDFLKETDWGDFLLEYHRDTPLVGVRTAKPPRAPVLHTRADPRRRRARG